jgi:hypothetical protein
MLSPSANLKETKVTSRQISTYHIHMICKSFIHCP